MKPLFPASANAIYWLAIGSLAFVVLALPAALIAWARTPYATGQQEPATQPIKFDHRHHVRDDGIDCLYCHDGARRAPLAGVPATSLCMGCHGQIWSDSPELAPVRSSYFEGRPIHWRRVSSLPDFVFFNHAIHVNKGVGCVTCHGRVDLMAQVYAAASLTMRFCMDCHREPEPHLRPLASITNMEWTPDRPQVELGRELRVQLDVHPSVDCVGCHR